MGWDKKRAFVAGGLSLLALAAWQLAPTLGQPPETAKMRFDFAVVESFDAKYLGDSPGHLGRGRIGEGQPDVALGDPVYRGDRLIGKVTGVAWDRSKENMEIEFDPEPFELDHHGRPAALNRVAVGERLWIPMGGTKAATPVSGDHLRP
jgi:hypothetical protein